MVALFTMRKYGVHQEFRFDEGIWVHRKSRQIRFFFSRKKRPCLHYTGATWNEQPTNINPWIKPQQWKHDTISLLQMFSFWREEFNKYLFCDIWCPPTSLYRIRSKMTKLMGKKSFFINLCFKILSTTTLLTTLLATI